MKERVVTAIVLAVATLFIVFLSSPYPAAAAVAGLGYLAGRELENLLKLAHLRYLTTGLTMAMSYAVNLGQPWAGLTLAAGALGVCLTLFKRGLWSVLWVSAPLALVLGLHRPLGPVAADVFEFRPVLLIALLPVWAGDTAAIFAGKAFGKHPLWPRISPKKTWEGSIANLLATVVVAAGIGSWIGFRLDGAIVLGIAMGITSQAGDLFESWLKREANVKDSGNLLPGHGGILDRIDSILFSVPTVVALLVLTSLPR